MEQIKTDEMTTALRTIGFDRVALRNGVWIVHNPSQAIMTENIREQVKVAFYNRYVVELVNMESHPTKGIIYRFKLARNEELVSVKNLLGGWCQIPAYNVGTCCDPSTERYHSM